MKVIDNYQETGKEIFSECFGITEDRMTALIAHYEAARTAVVDRYVRDPEYMHLNNIKPYPEVATELDNNGEEYTEAEIFFLRHMILVDKESYAKVIAAGRAVKEECGCPKCKGTSGSKGLSSLLSDAANMDNKSVEALIQSMLKNISKE